MSVTSPFVFDKPVPPEDLVGRDVELATLADRAAHGRFLLLAAPRRYGKTSLVHRLAADGAASGDLHVVHVDLLGVQQVADVTRRLARALRDIPAPRLRSVLESLVRHTPAVAATLGWGSLSVSARRSPERAPEADLEALLDLPAQAAKRLKASVLVVLDEFQDIANVAGADATIRSVIQHQRGAAAYLFAGSEPSLLQAIFSDRRRALYTQAERISLGPLPADALGTFIEARFAGTGRRVAGGALAEFLDFVEGHPQRSMLLAHHWWSITPERSSATRERLVGAVENALVAFNDEAAQLVARLTPAQAKVARLVAHGLPVHGSAAQALKLAKSTASEALTALRTATIVTPSPETRLVDPLFAEWLRRELPAPDRPRERGPRKGPSEGG